MDPNSRAWIIRWLKLILVASILEQTGSSPPICAYDVYYFTLSQRKAHRSIWNFDDAEADALFGGQKFVAVTMMEPGRILRIEVITTAAVKSIFVKRFLIFSRQAVVTNSEKFNNECGIICRKGCPFEYMDWRKVPKSVKATLRERILIIWDSTV
ncbi:hypothetical protein L6452_07186 [Arctium lappa]|uniref:Uncharacterized protein n=1 Tax=Arctium lappa TaxID=4217 RepID=A0ACB9ELR3_ARCLA|nr:hypothetical protein L6452_07186 [Arctium lappa]